VTLQVKGWNEFFESAKTRTWSNKSQTYMPNKQGLGYRRLIALPNGEALYGAWCSMCHLLSHQPKPRQGYLTDTGQASGCPYSAADLSLLTGFTVATMQAMLDACKNPEIGWISEDGISQGYHGDTTGIPIDPRPLPLPSPSPSPSPVVKDSSSPAGDGRGETDAQPTYSQDFLTFWETYPRKVGKGAAWKSWKRAKGRPPVGELLDAIRLQSRSEQWRKEGGQFVPHPATWLNQARWDDAPDPSDDSAHGIDPETWEGTPVHIIERINQPVYGFDWHGDFRHESEFTAAAEKAGMTLRQFLDWREAWAKKHGAYSPERPRPTDEPGVI
jgi:hypothetical protein